MGDPDPGDLNFLVLEAAISSTIKPFNDLELHSSTDSDGFACIIIRKINHVLFPISPRLIEDTTLSKEWRELNCVLFPVRIVISFATLKSSLQVFGAELSSIESVVKKVERPGEDYCWEVSSDILEQIRKLTHFGNYRICNGFTEEELNLNDPGQSKPYSLVKCNVPFPRLESPRCTKLIEPGHSKGKNICKPCNTWLMSQKWFSQKKKRSLENSELENTSTPRKKVCRTHVSSSVPISYLTPTSKKNRINNIRRNRQSLTKYILTLQRKINKMAITLSKSQNDEMVDIVKLVDKNFAKELDSIIDEGGDYQVSRKLRQAWQKDRLSHHSHQKKDFFEDQVKNRTGYKGNSWSAITYRLALAVYIRSPAAYSALKSFHILNLPSEGSLKDFTAARIQQSGINHQYLADQKDLFEKLKVEQRDKGFLEPLGEGILIYDEVRVISKLMWNSSNNELQGLALKTEEYATLLDVYQELQNDAVEKPTDYVLQFLWRDVSYYFDVIGPYITSSGTVKKDVLVGCLYDTIRVFEAYNFHIRALVCDGASTNLSVIKGMMNCKGAFGYDENEVNHFDRHTIFPSMKHPFRPYHKIFFIICPSHQLKNMIAALYSSREKQNGGTKSFENKGISFGWKPIVQVYDEDIARAKLGEARRVKGLLKSFIHRDSWTRLNVKPAKIMQQDAMLTALNEIAAPINSCPPPHASEIAMTRNYLLHCNNIFESGILDSSRRITAVNDPLFDDMLKGYEFFTDWINGLLENPEFKATSKDQKLFISWQTWDLLRVMVFGFIGFAKDFIKDFPTRFILPVRINGSAIESLFGQMRFSTAGKLSGVNYSFAQRGLLLKYDVHGRRFNKNDYRKAPIAVANT